MNVLKRWTQVLGVIGCMFWPMSAVGQGSATELGPLVVTATLAEKAVDQVPGAVEVLDQQQLVETGAETVSEALLYATGVMLITAEGRNVGTSIRGIGRNHTLVMLDGRRLAGSFKAQMDVAQLPVTMVERIEVVRGPASALYGSDAIGGVINIITRQPTAQTEAGLDVRGGFGPSAEHLGQIYVGGGSENIQANLGVARSVKDDWDGDSALPDDVDETSLNSVLGRANVNIGPKQQLLFGGEYGHFERDGGRYYQNINRRYDADDRRWGGFAEYHLNQGEPLSAMVRGYASQYKATSSFDPPTSKSEERRRLIQGEGRVTYSTSNRFILTSGGEVREDSLKVGGMDHNEEKVLNSALFTQADWRITQQLNLVAGVRFDHHEDFGGHLTPRATLTWHYDHGRVWIGYGEGFRAPNLNELYVTSILKKGFETYQNNEDLDEETSQSYEAGTSFHWGRFRSQLVVFRTDLDDLIAAQLQSASGKYKTFTMVNIDEVRAEGVEFESSVALPGDVQLSGQFSYVDTEDRQTHDELADEPRWKSGVTLAWLDPYWGVMTQVRWLYFGTSEDGESNEQDAYQLTHLHVEKDLTASLTLYGGIDNLFDEEHDDFTLSPRGYYLGVKWVF
ncbi:TonB-dependent receptor [Desulfuromonas acetoxidans]|uniref:TonB-dependent receptor n=1 Tax=Desulfuromonas acetoxidans (strain DSM 684 / 11070) TaxID=281689 RepID=Q1K101_DESA6|nr:TonB-dependent receptor [Desulfuromonas acetoxidans]EAT16207.1 TonB-dependent receptor [Desulfuromonas acetoxidans DSM 684]MBF0645219.1 TonB-dependent receptor [Desulfuromonas acetoxidans]NVD23037.1 TonB-dependent receptor [Desulfuromonas acetoxidans]NVE15722.1 TonB-dependent receptor [Desulfuromonas acetoxidans]